MFINLPFMNYEILKITESKYLRENQRTEMTCRVSFHYFFNRSLTLNRSQVRMGSTTWCVAQFLCFFMTLSKVEWPY